MSGVTAIGRRRNLATSWNGWVYLNPSRVPAFTAPSSLTATPSGTTNALAWTNGAATAQTVIERSLTGSSGWSVIATKDAGVASHNDTGLTNATYYYRVRHVQNSQYSIYSSNASGTISGGAAGFVTGSSYTLTGTGFGTKAEPLPIMFDDFSSGTVDARVRPNAPTVSASGTWVWDDHGISSTRPVYSNAVLRANSSRNAKAAFSGSINLNALELIDNNFTGVGDEKFISWWMYYDITGAGYSDNFKPFMVYGNFENQIPEFYLGWGLPPSDGGLRNSFQDKVSGASASGIINPTVNNGPHVDDIAGKWIKFEVWLKQSTADTYDGAYQVRVHTPDDSVPIELTHDDTTARTRLYSDRYYRNFFIGSFHRNTGGTSANIYISDVYSDNTRQRVELGDAATWAACTKTETQVATAWSNTSITIRANAGAFTAGQTAYLYVINSDGSLVSTSGAAVTVG